MLSTPCPRCGRPAPLSIASPAVLACPACGYAGATPPKVAADLHAAGRVLAQANVRERQLTVAQQRALARSSSQDTTFFLVLGLSLLPAGCAAIAGTGLVVEEDAPDSAAKLVFFVAPLFLVIASGLLSRRWMSGRRAKLREAVTAVPPAAPGAPCACHLCGAPLVTGPAAMIRCGHCGADNLVSAGALEQLRSRRHAVLEGYEAHLRSELHAVGQAAARASAMALLGSLFIPPIFLTALAMTLLPVMMIERKADLTQLYVHKTFPSSGDCIGEVTRLRKGGFKLYFGGVGSGENEFEEVTALDRPFDAAALVGRAIVVDGKAGTIRRVYANPILGNHTDIAMDDGGHRTDAPHELCFAGPPAAARDAGDAGARDAGDGAHPRDGSAAAEGHARAAPHDAGRAADAGHAADAAAPARDAGARGLRHAPP